MNSDPLPADPLLLFMDMGYKGGSTTLLILPQIIINPFNSKMK